MIQKILSLFRNTTFFFFEVRHPRCVGSITKNFYVLHNTVEHNYIVVFDCMCNTQKLLKNEIPTLCHLLFYFTSYVLNMFRTLLIYPSLGACDCVVELPHRSSCSVKTGDLALV